jgi:hypothetical protein
VIVIVVGAICFYLIDDNGLKRNNKRELLPIVIADDEADGLFLDRPRCRGRAGMARFVEQIAICRASDNLH